ncbi:unnamed protein product, partial [Phaeothamnion confervicola]
MGDAEDDNGAAPPLAGVVLSSTGSTAAEKADVERLARLLGAEYSADLTQATTHLLAACTDSPKYRLAATLRSVTIVQPRWLFDCADRRALLPCDTYRVAPFHGLVVSVTGIALDRRAALIQAVLAHGRSYAGNFDRSVTV